MRQNARGLSLCKLRCEEPDPDFLDDNLFFCSAKHGPPEKVRGLKYEPFFGGPAADPSLLRIAAVILRAFNCSFENYEEKSGEVASSWYFPRLFPVIEWLRGCGLLRY